MVSSIPSSFPELYGAASVASHQEPGLSLVLKCGWTGTPGKPVPGLVWLPPSPGYAPFDWLLPCPEVERHFTKRNKASMLHFISFSPSCPSQSSLVMCWLTPCLGRASVSQSVTSSRMSAAWPQLHMQSNSWLYCAGTAPGSILRSLDRTPQLGTREQDEGGRLDRIESTKKGKRWQAEWDGDTWMLELQLEAWMRPVEWEERYTVPPEKQILFLVYSFMEE